MRLKSNFPLLIVTLSFSILLVSLADNSKQDLNSVNRQELEAIPGIGPLLASKIIYERNRRGGFRSMADLLKIQGISRKTLTRLKKRLYIANTNIPKRKETL